MKTTLLSISLAVLACPVFAQSADYCAAVLTQRAYNTKDNAVSSTTFLRLRNDVCDQKHESASAAESYARKGGFKLGYGDLSISLKDDKQTGQNSYNVKNSTFCQSNADDFQSIYGGNYKEVIASDAVAAWRECVRAHRGNQLFIEYTPSSDGQLLSGTLYMTVLDGTLERKLLGWKAIGAVNGLNCGIGGKSYDLTNDLSEPIDIDQTGTSVLCEKTRDGPVIIGFQISSGAVEIEMPSKTELLNKEYDELEAKLDESISRIEERIADVESDLNAFKSMSDEERADLYSKVNFVNGLLPNIITYGSRIQLRSNEPGATNLYIRSNHGQNQDPNDVLLTGSAGGLTTFTVEK